MTRRSSVKPHTTVTLVNLPGLWYVESLAPKPATYYLSGKDSFSQSLCSLLPHGRLVVTSKEIRQPADTPPDTIGEDHV